MGIKGLLQFLKDQQTVVNLKTYRGCTAGVDVYCWLHRAVYGCVDQIAIAGNDQGQLVTTLATLLSVRLFYVSTTVCF